MTKRELGSLAFKLAGIYALVEAVLNVPMVGMPLTKSVRHTFESGDQTIMLIFDVLPTVVLLLFGAALIRYSERLSAWTLSDGDAPATTAIDVTDLQATLLAVVGVAMIVSALPAFARFGAYGWVNQQWAVLLREMAPELTQLILEVLLGVALIACRRFAAHPGSTVRRTWRTLRGRDVPRE
jgi:hypothetical protein